MEKKLKFIQINIYKGKWLDALLDFLKKENPDVVAMQEVSSFEANYWQDKSCDIFEVIKKDLGLNGVFYNCVDFSDAPRAKVGNAVLTRFPITSSKQVVLKEYTPITLAMYEQPEFFPEFARNICDAKVDFDGVAVHFLSAHGAWTAPPVDTPETLRQAGIIADHLKSLTAPSLMGCDMNTTPDKEVIATIDKVANNLMKNSGILRTTHPKVHKVAYKQLLVDYIFTSAEFKLLKISVPEVLVSDHLPVICELEFNA